MSSNVSIQQIQDWLKQNKTASIQLFDENQNIVVDKLHYRDLSDFDYNLSSYFEYLFGNNPYQYVSIQKKRKNGNYRVDAGSQRVKVSPIKKSVVESGAKDVANDSHVGSTQQQQNYNPMQQQQPSYPAYQSQPLNAPAGMQHAEWIKHLTNSERYREQYDRAEKYERLYEAQKEKNEELKEKILEYTIGEKSKPGLVESIVEVVKNNPELAQAIMMAKGGGGVAQQQIPGLSGAQNISEKAQYVIGNIIKDTPDDDILDRLILLVQEYKKGNETFINAMEAQYNQLNKQKQTA